ncbi:K6-linked polyubiquitin modification-dependent protein binding [Nakaseomyces bracarensis]|uniref:K6-linked polyubiquitin modification-dependent protein binding n=1 Tax=Nakaseomyces bracarensis TaxID=273131 RepID=A0ABR4NVM0_9SACH
MEIEDKLWNCVRYRTRLVVVVLPQGSKSEPIKAMHDKEETIEIVPGTKSFSTFERLYGPVSIPSYNIIDPNGEVYTTSNINDLQRKLMDGSHNKVTKYETSSQDIERRRILDLIEADKLERQNKHFGETNVMKPLDLVDKFKNERILDTDTCTLQIRFTNGDSVRYTFDSSSTLKSVREWLNDLRTDGEVPYLFHRNIPRMDYKPEDELKTLAELDLTPRSILMMKPNDLRPRTRIQKKKKSRRSSMLKEFIVRLKKCWIDDQDSEENNNGLMGDIIKTNDEQPPNPLIHRTSTDISNKSSLVGNGQYNSLLEMNQELDTPNDPTILNGSTIKFKKSFELGGDLPSRAQSPIAF